MKMLSNIMWFFEKRKMKKAGFSFPKITQQLNPLCELRVEYQGKQIFKQPFLLIIHAYLKTFGFSPDSKDDGSLMVVFNFGQGDEFKFPLWVNKLEGENFGKTITAEEAIQKGYLILPKK